MQENDKKHLETELEALRRMMEEMANQPKEEYGKRQPGERNSMERSNRSSSVDSRT